MNFYFFICLGCHPRHRMVWLCRKTYLTSQTSYSGSNYVFVNGLQVTFIRIKKNLSNTRIHTFKFNYWSVIILLNNNGAQFQQC